MSVSVMGVCACGGSPSEPNYECERCRLVYFVLTVRHLRAKSHEYIRTRGMTRKNAVADEYRRLESKIDKMLAKFCEPIQQPEQEEFLGDDDRYYDQGT